MPPEYINFQIISKEYDISSLGVIMVKIIVGPEEYFRIDDIGPAKFRELVRKLIKFLILCVGHT